MGFWKTLWKKKSRKKQFENDEYDPLDAALDSASLDYEGEERSVDMHNVEEREKYVRSLVQQMKDASKQLDELSNEYNLVTGYLTDMEEIEALPESEHKLVTDYAAKISRLDQERDQFQGKPAYLPEEDYKRIERMEGEVEEGLGKLESAEKYQQVIKRDLKKLDGERQAYAFRRSELYRGMNNLQGISTICFVTIVICVIMLLVLQFAFHLETKIGYLILAGAVAVFLTFLYVKQTDATRELAKVERAINKLIQLQNRVKIRYVNNTNLLDYLYLKYEVPSAAALQETWEKYLQERTEREKYEHTIEDLDYYQKELVRTLRRYHLRDPYIWTHQAEALVNHNEMVEIRHGLITRRQKLRKQMDYNRELAVGAQNQIKGIIERFPAFAKNILNIVSEEESYFN